MGGALRKPPAGSDAYAVKSAGSESKGSTSNKIVPTVADADALLDLEEELEAKREEERAQRQKAAVTHVVDNLFPYAPVKVQTQKYPAGSPKAGQAYVWITVDEDAIKRKGGAFNSPIRYPTGVAVDADGNVFVSEAHGHTDKGDGGGEERESRKITVDSIMQLATANTPPPTPTPPVLVHAEQTSLVVKWKKSHDTTVDKYEAQFRLADSPNNLWAALVTVFVVKDVSLDNLACNTPYEFRVRCHNPAGWSNYSESGGIYWTKPGIPSRPNPPVPGTIVDTYVSMFWSPVKDNGAPPVMYKLEVRENDAGHHTSFTLIYQGRNCGYVADNLRANAAHVFRVQAFNSVGCTEWVECRPIKTMAHPKPEIVELTSEEQSSASDRWVQCWDPKTERVFYFNRYTSQRQTEEPPELIEARAKQGIIQVEETPDMIFRRKRFRFHKEVRQGLAGVSLASSLPLELERDTMFDGTFKAFQRFTKQDLAAKTKITFANEAGIDSGGLTKDWFLQISKLAVAKPRHLFKPCDAGHYEIEPTSFKNTQHLQQFKFLGKFIAKAIFDRQTMDLPLCDTIFKLFLHQTLTLDDLKAIDSQFHKSLVWMLENDIAGVIDETFSVEVEAPGNKVDVVDLKENGRDIPVTDLNKQEYVDLILKWRTEYGIKSQLDAIFQGFATLIPLASLKVFELAEFRMLVNGKPTIDVEELRANVVFQGGYNEHSQVVLWLWQALREFPLELRGHFLKFMTGTNKIPLDGFEPPLNLTKSDLDPQALPRTHTCFNQLVLPEYSSYETLVDKITFAIKNAEGFDLS
ncbi:TPA: hypothetical protein N0F65_002813 [Lagenidium giganteum]|uniref:HECT-type E3 ubiquitin transferase n=1 Tax=Lagenidium giganteum TaxID=4803 RepID=A0AAV2ZBU2_9STRA|nr:TPA: hypothetical protein N0F65_002813 [Lagenidium giganteum]